MTRTSESYYVVRMCLFGTLQCKLAVRTRERESANAKRSSFYVASNSVVVVLSLTRSRLALATSLAPPLAARYASIFLCSLQFECIGATPNKLRLCIEYISTTFSVCQIDYLLFVLCTCAWVLSLCECYLFPFRFKHTTYDSFCVQFVYLFTFAAEFALQSFTSIGTKKSLWSFYHFVLQNWWAPWKLQFQ